MKYRLLCVLLLWSTLSWGDALTPQPDPTLQKHATQWLIVSGATLTVGAATLITGVRFFNQGKNAKKIATGDALINVGLGVSISAVLPLGVSGYWYQKYRKTK